eukprot:TRINITY_DN8558_c0_g1_i2.p1 TRINITY_DN8558_c0_g1~~TRINITY_DN8558_c0_g1_i2.p1  ORF type:complete len:100 (-),score=3.33 TRINITY_DN8558_c0_g1_i2:33-332(-)
MASYKHTIDFILNQKHSQNDKLQTTIVSNKQESNERSHHDLGILRQQLYCDLVDQPGRGPKSCPFECSKVLSGNGNLRRHIEWHLSKMERQSPNFVRST